MVPEFERTLFCHPNWGPRGPWIFAETQVDPEFHWDVKVPSEWDTFVVAGRFCGMVGFGVQRLRNVNITVR